MFVCRLGPVKSMMNHIISWQVTEDILCFKQQFGECFWVGFKLIPLSFVGFDQRIARLNFFLQKLLSIFWHILPFECSILSPNVYFSDFYYSREIAKGWFYFSTARMFHFIQSCLEQERLNRTYDKCVIYCEIHYMVIFENLFNNYYNIIIV